MNVVRKGISVVGSVLATMIVAGSTRYVPPKNHTTPKQLLAQIKLKAQPLVDSIKINTIDCMDDGPVLPNPLNKK